MTKWLLGLAVAAALIAPTIGHCAVLRHSPQLAQHDQRDLVEMWAGNTRNE
jgi:uncharacterized membrane protein